MMPLSVQAGPKDPPHQNSAKKTFMLTTASQSPAVPKQPNASDNTFTDKVYVKWQPVRGANRYRVFRCRNTSTSARSCSEAGVVSGSHLNDTAAIPDRIYYYRIQACRNAVCSSLSKADKGIRKPKLSSIQFTVPFKVTHINPQIKEIVPMCRLFNNSVLSNANEVGLDRTPISVNGRTQIKAQAHVQVSTNLHPGKKLEDSVRYSCTLYVSKKTTSGLFAYSTTTSDPALKAASPPTNVVTGNINIHNARLTGNVAAGNMILSIRTKPLNAQGISVTPKPTAIKFSVPLNVRNIHADIHYVVPRCGIFTGSVMSNANELGLIYKYFPVDQYRRVKKNVTLTLTQAQLHPGKSMDNVTKYACTLYIATGVNQPHLIYDRSSSDDKIKAYGTPVNVVTGNINPASASGSGTINVQAGQLRATGSILGVPAITTHFRNIPTPSSGSQAGMHNIRNLDVRITPVQGAQVYMYSVKYRNGEHNGHPNHPTNNMTHMKNHLVIFGATSATFVENCQKRILAISVKACLSEANANNYATKCGLAVSRNVSH